MKRSLSIKIRSKKMIVSEYIAEVLAIQTSGKVFGVVGGAIELLLDQIHKNEKLEFIGAMSENSGVMMASTYSQAVDEITVVTTTTGPGVANSLNGMMAAYKERAKILMITPQNKRASFGKNPLQDSSPLSVSTLKLLEPCTIYNQVITEESQIVQILDEAINYINHYNKPAHISIPIDLLNKEIDFSHGDYKIKKLNNLEYLGEHSLMTLENKLKDNSCIVYGKRAYGYIKELSRIVNKLKIDVYTTPSGKSCISYDNLHFKGVIGMGGYISDEEFDQYTNIIFIGEDLSDYNTNNWSQKIINNKLLLIDDDRDNVLSRINDYDSIYIDNIKNYKIIADNLDGCDDDEFCANKREILSTTSEGDTIDIPDLFAVLNKDMEDVTACFFDPGSSYLWAINMWNVIYNKDYRSFNIAIESSSMTSGINNAIGFSLHDKKIPTMIVTGDGSFLMNSHELLIAKRYNLPIVFVILNDGEYGIVKHGQNMNGSSSIGNKLMDLNFQEYASFIGIKSLIIKNKEDLSNMNLSKLQSGKEPILLDCRISKDTPPPLQQRLKNITIGESDE
jgi:acetolactate synthase-1/2/3 large subunit